MHRLMACPGIWLAALALLLGVILAACGRFAPRMESDSAAYADPNISFSAPTSGHRTWGYPLFLRCLGSIERTPLAHYVVHAAACGIFLAGLLRVGYRPWTAWWCSATLLFGRAVFDLGPLILADALAISLAVAAAGCLFAVLSERAGIGAWAGLVAFTFLAYQVRPAYLFLIPLWPILSLVLNVWLLRRSERLPVQLRRAGAVALATVIPFCAYGTLRWCIVGQWGLVSFGGYNIIGIAGQYLDRELADELPVEVRPLAAEIVRRRSESPEILPPHDFPTMCTMFNPTVWQLAVPAAKATAGDDAIAVNRQLTRLSQAILVRRPERYRQWLIENFVHAVKQWIGLTACDKGTFALGVAYLVMHFLALVRGRRTDDALPQVRTPDDPDVFRLELHLLFWTALIFAVAQTSLVVLVEPAISRYMMGAMIFFPATAAVWVAHAVSAGVRGAPAARVGIVSPPRLE